MGTCSVTVRKYKSNEDRNIWNNINNNLNKIYDENLAFRITIW